jgi:chromosomal replication initiation ATPase DnaA
MDDVIKRKVVIRKQDRIDYILNGVADYYKTSVADIISYKRKKSLVNRKRLTIKLLYDVADCTLKDITYALGYCDDNFYSVYSHLKDIREDISAPTTDGRLLKQEHDNIINFLNI